VIVGRKGLGRATIRVRGRAAHAGVAPQDGVSAVVEMATKILRIEALRDLSRGLSVVTGVARGGISRNTVPPAAELEVDIRYADKADGERALAGLREIAARCEVPGASATIEAELHRPPMRPESAPGDLLERARRWGAAIDAPLPDAVTSGGGSDANLTADLGVPTLDGLGVVGGAIHTVDEYCERASLPGRAALSALLLADLLEIH
jgi:glutamate carboxypeptidase